MNATAEKLEKNFVKLTIEVSKEDVEKALEQGYKKLAKKVSLPGFRKGKAPRKLIEMRFGKAPIYEEALEILVPNAYSEAVEQTGIEPIDQPKIDIEKFEEDEPFVFYAEVQVKPEVKLGDYKNLKIEREKVSVTDEDVDKYIDGMRERLSELVTVERDTVQEGDFAVIDFEGFVDSEPFPGGKAENYTLEIGSKSFIPGFEEQLVGKKVGEEFEIQVKFPEDYHQESLAGKDATFKVTVKELKEKKVPELNDEFAKEVGDFETFDAYKADVRERLEKIAAEREENEYKNKVVEAVVDAAEVEVPEVMIEHEIDHMIEDFAMRLRYQGLDLDKFLEYVNKKKETLREEYRKDAEKRVKADLVLEAVIKAENIDVTEEEIDKEIAELASRYNRDVEAVKEQFRKGGNLEQLKNGMKLQKAIDYLANQCQG